jgi:DeoR/GlpR family transcriptional regulator of sugar metabolism
VGRLAAETLGRINTDLAFISGSSWDIVRGLTTPTESKVGVKRAAIDSAASCILLVTSSKFGTFGMYDVVPLRQFDRIITDWKLPDGAARGVNDLGVAIERAPQARATHLG